MFDPNNIVHLIIFCGFVIIFVLTFFLPRKKKIDEETDNEKGDSKCRFKK